MVNELRKPKKRERNNEEKGTWPKYVSNPISHNHRYSFPHNTTPIFSILPTSAMLCRLLHQKDPTSSLFVALQAKMGARGVVELKVTMPEKIREYVIVVEKMGIILRSFQRNVIDHGENMHSSSVLRWRETKNKGRLFNTCTARCGYWEWFEGGETSAISGTLKNHVTNEGAEELFATFQSRCQLSDQ
ncbi:Hypothetical predicted protein [Olea europaea subsp. europaea]|uniref:Uncharacterized protein n=1 Tax=Olea europaea subsp. europaea TaxID=158383 RepID=A0A8S0S2E7_OLEEU|nr:Hypothetical predicted protein [Olea europaea subsp. europaea]